MRMLGRADLERLHTGTLMRFHRLTAGGRGRVEDADYGTDAEKAEVWDGARGRTQFAAAHLKAVLESRPHVPNAMERARSRIELLKSRRNRG